MMMKALDVVIGRRCLYYVDTENDNDDDPTTTATLIVFYFYMMDAHFSFPLLFSFLASLSSFLSCLSLPTFFL